MKRKIIILSAVYLLLTSFAGCTKKSEDDFSGTWVPVYVESEDGTRRAADCQSDTLTLNKDGTAEYIIAGFKVPFNWKISDDGDVVLCDENGKELDKLTYSSGELFSDMYNKDGTPSSDKRVYVKR